MLAREHKYPSVLQSLLRERYNMQGIDVFNAGRSWYTTKHSLINYVTNLRDWQPDLVLVMHAVNDLNRSFSSTEFAIGPYNRLWSHYYGPAIRGAKPPTFTQHLVARYFSSFFFVWYSDLRYRQRDYPLDHFISVTDFERYLRRLVHHIRDDGRQSVLITQPFLYKERMTPDELRALRFGKIHCRTRSGFLQEEYPSPGSLRTAMDAFNDVIRRVARTEGVPLADAEARIEKNLENFTDDVHYTVIGARRLATAIAETIIEQGLIRPGKQGD